MKGVYEVLSPGSLAERPVEPVWLIQNLWAHQGVGIIAGAPKSCKSWLALDMAVSVASNTPCLGLFPVTLSGRVLLYMAEDSLSILCQRMKALVLHKSLNLNTLNIGILNPDAFRLDQKGDQIRLEKTIQKEKPVLLILDPLIRMHGIDENSSGDVSLILAYLRNLQRNYNTAVCVVHHARKNGGTGYRQGLGIRGSSDFHAWGDTNLYLRRKDNHLMLTLEQRAASALDPLAVELVTQNDDMPHLEVIDEPNGVSQKQSAFEDIILDILRKENVPVLQKMLRGHLKIRNQILTEVLRKLQGKGKISRTNKGWYIPENPADKLNKKKTVPVPIPKKKRERNTIEQNAGIPVPIPKKKRERNTIEQNVSIPVPIPKKKRERNTIEQFELPLHYMMFGETKAGSAGEQPAQG